MNMFTHLKKLAVIAGLSLSFVQPANAIMLDIQSGTNALLGIDDIDINGILWDVDFVDGVWHEIDGDFATSTSGSKTYATAFALTEAQLDIGHAKIKAFLDSPASVVGGINYGRRPEFISGCPNSVCIVHTPYAAPSDLLNLEYDVNTLFVRKKEKVNFVPDGTLAIDLDLASSDKKRATFAVWSQAQVSAVPEPASYAMLLAGLGLLGLAKRRQQA